MISNFEFSFLICELKTLHVLINQENMSLTSSALYVWTIVHCICISCHVPFVFASCMYSALTLTCHSWIYYRPLKCKTGGSDFCVIPRDYKTHVHYVHLWHPFCNSGVHVIYLRLSGQCSHAILLNQKIWYCLLFFSYVMFMIKTAIGFVCI